MKRSITARALALGLVLPVVGCSAGGGGAALVPGSQTPVASSAARLPVLHPLGGSAAFLYVANATGSSSSSSSSSGGASVNVYRIGGKQIRFARSDSGGISDPRGLGFDGNGNLYVVNGAGGSSSSSSSSSGSVVEFAAGSGNAIRTYTDGVTSPTAVAVDGRGFVYIANGAASSSSSSSSGTGSVTVYRPNHGRVARTITNGIGDPRALAFDGNGNLYVLNGSAASSSSSSGAGASVSIYGPGHTDPKSTISSGISSPTAFAVDGAGDVIVANGSNSSASSGAPGSVTVYLAGTTTPAATITNGIANPRALALDAAGDLFVSNFSGGSSSSSSSGAAGSVTVYSAGSSSPKRTITDGINNPAALVAEGNGTLFVANFAGSSSSSSSSGGTVTEYAPGSSRVRHTITNHVNDPVALGLGSF